MKLNFGPESQPRFSMLQDVTRKVKPEVTLLLWVLAGGRCQFRDCNELLYKSPVTQERVNRAQKAHIYSYSLVGSRGRGPYAQNAKGLNSTENLMLVCYGCHQKIDQKGGSTRYTAAQLQQWKQEHEARIVRVTGVNPKHKTHIVLYGSRIGEQDAPLQPHEVMAAVFPERFPATDTPHALSLHYEHNDGNAAFWITEATHLRNLFEREISPLIRHSRATHFSVFGLADIPLLALLGSLFTDKIPVDVYQRFREPLGWRWPNHAPRSFRFILKRPQRRRGRPVFVLSLSGRIEPERVYAILGRNVAIWELTVADPHNDLIRSCGQLGLFRQAVRRAMVAINSVHGRKPVSIFPAIPVSCAVELGRVRMPQSDPAWVFYNQNNRNHGFTEALTIGENHEQIEK